MTKPVFRFAPSPNGELHLGHAYSALLNADMARKAGGRLLLRIEDIDIARCTPEFEVAIYRDLEWLGVEWEEPVRRQSDHFPEYGKLLDRLIAEDLVYPAFMSRGEIRAHIAQAEDSGRTWPRDPDGVPLYPGLDKALGVRERNRRIAEGEPFAWRLDTEAAVVGLNDPLAWTEISDADPNSVRKVEARPGPMGRRRAGTPRRADELPPVRRRRRRAAGYNSCRARPRSFPGHRHPPAAAGTAGPASAGLFPSPADPRPGQPKALQELSRYRAQRAEERRTNA